MVFNRANEPMEDCITCFFPPMGNECPNKNVPEGIKSSLIHFQVDGYKTTFGTTENFATPIVVRRSVTEKYSKNSVTNICLKSQSPDKKVFDYFPVLDSRIFMKQLDVVGAREVDLTVRVRIAFIKASKVALYR